MGTGAWATNGGVVKWSQPPDMETGVNIKSIEGPPQPIVADDWRCLDPKPVTDVHFWGSYIKWQTEHPHPQFPTPGVKGFVIRIYKDIPADPPNVPYSHPGELLYEMEIIDDFVEEYVASIEHPDGYEHKFYYSLDLPEPFHQEEGTIYWISIAALIPDGSEFPWGWETSKDHWNDNAVRGWEEGLWWENLGELDGSPIDMAFLLITRDDTRYCKGDFDRDGDVDGSDLAVFAADFGRTDCYNTGDCDGDVVYDGDVDGSDLAVFAADFGRTDCPCALPVNAH